MKICGSEVETTNMFTFLLENKDERNRFLYPKWILYPYLIESSESLAFEKLKSGYSRFIEGVIIVRFPCSVNPHCQELKYLSFNSVKTL